MLRVVRQNEIFLIAKINLICNKLEINIISTPSKPNKEEYIYGKDLKLSYEEKQLMKSFIREEIQKFPALPNDL
tara:strand:+ start:81 stop:302 length:222 start_codon:yes stop_codon:yes gene_type:complete